ncbi:hypothetical protein [Roseibium sp.]|uniref:hypothetical protein n=1 Tax=Roseibium sp. TaxID=1936156 RepID=UPI003BA92BA7
MKKFPFAVLFASAFVAGQASATSIVKFEEDQILSALARVTLSSEYCKAEVVPQFNTMDLVWDVVELKTGVDPNESPVREKYFSIMDEWDAKAQGDRSAFCSDIYKDYGPYGQDIADLVKKKG